MKTTNQTVLDQLINVAQDVFNYNVQFWYDKQNSWTLQQILSEPFTPKQPDGMPESQKISADGFECNFLTVSIFTILKQWSKLEKLPKNFEFINKSEQINTFGLEKYVVDPKEALIITQNVIFDDANGVIFATDKRSLKAHFIPKKEGVEPRFFDPVAKKLVTLENKRIPDINRVILKSGVKFTIPEPAIKTALKVAKKLDVIFDIEQDGIKISVPGIDYSFEVLQAQEPGSRGIFQLTSKQLNQIKTDKINTFFAELGNLTAVKNDYIFVFFARVDTKYLENRTTATCEGSPQNIIYPDRPAPVQAETVKRKTRKIKQFRYKTKKVYFTPIAPEPEPIRIRKTDYSILYKIAALFALVFILSYQTAAPSQIVQEITLKEVICTASAPVYCFVLPEVVCTGIRPVKEVILKEVVCTAQQPIPERVQEINKIQPEIAVLIVDCINVPQTVSNVSNSTGTPTASNPGANILNTNLVTSINLIL